MISNQGVNEYQRLFKHFQKIHSQILSDTLLKYLIDHPVSQEKLSSIPIVDDYIKINIIPIYLNEKQKSDSIVFNIIEKQDSEHLLDISKIDAKKINQTISEQGIYEHLPLNTICSKTHSEFLKGFMLYGYEIAKYTDITPSQFTQICNKIDVSRNLLDKVGDDYYESGTSVFKGGYASFQIDASKSMEKKFWYLFYAQKTDLLNHFYLTFNKILMVI